jgi:hypothetical protein
MSNVTIRPFERSDREQVTALVNVHQSCVWCDQSAPSVPGLLRSMLTGNGDTSRSTRCSAITGDSHAASNWLISATSLLSQRSGDVASPAGCSQRLDGG